MISGIVLAAGESRRFGATKQILEVGGSPLAQHPILTLADAGVDEILVVTGHEADAVEAALTLPPGGRFVRNERYREGQSSSLAVALHAVDPDSEAAVVLQGDQPGVSPDEVRGLIAAFRETRGAIVRIRYADGPGPALLSREVYAEAGHLHGDVGARVLIASHPEWVVDVPVERRSPRDVDRPEDVPD